MQDLKNLLDRILNFSDDGIIYIDKDGKVDIYHDSYTDDLEGRALATVRQVKDSLEDRGINEDSELIEIAEFFEELRG